MLLKLDKPDLLLNAVDLVYELVSEARLKITENGLSLTAIDPANVAMVNFRIPKSAFLEYEAEKEVLGINLESLKKVLKRCKSKSVLVLKKNENLLEVEIQDRIKRNFNLNLIEVEAEDKEMPDLEFSAKVEIDSVDFIDAVEDCSVVADSCSFVIKESKFIIEAKGMNSSKAEFSSDEAKIEAEDCKAKYSLEYLQKFTKGAKNCDKVFLNFANDHPLKLDLKKENLSLSFILAPRVETED